MSNNDHSHIPYHSYFVSSDRLNSNPAFVRLQSQHSILLGSMAMQASQLAMETTLAPVNVQCDACK